MSRSLMIKRVFPVAVVVIVNCAVLAACLAVVEMGFRFNEKNEAAAGPTTQWLKFTPFMMFTNPHVSGGYQWKDAIHDQVIPSKMVNNQLGFAMREEVDFSKVRPKAENDRVVVFTGGSAAWGVGATSNETNIAGRLQSVLNESQSKYRYIVLNLAMGGWVSVQQMIALSLYGRNLQPDWLVAMDGTNDVAVACAHSQGAGHVMHYGLMDAYMKAYVFGQRHPELYRSWLENELIRHSAAYRRITGKTPVDFDLFLDARDPGVGRSVVRRTTWADVERQLELYVQTESEMIDLLPRAKVVLSTQPLPLNFEDMFGRIYGGRGTAEEATAISTLTSQLEEIRVASRGKRCGLELWEDARRWFMPMSALRLEGMANQYRNAGRNVQYVNVGALFPNSRAERDRFFIDPVHLNDLGMDVVARFYSAMILAADLPDQFVAPEWTGKPLPDPHPDARTPDEIRIIEATYGMSCKSFKVLPPAENKVRIGNATDVVAGDCMRKRGTCNFTVDVRRLADPAQNCGKDFSVNWQCGAKSNLHQAYIAGEASGKSVSLACPAN